MRRGGSGGVFHPPSSFAGRSRPCRAKFGSDAAGGSGGVAGRGVLFAVFEAGDGSGGGGVCESVRACPNFATRPVLPFGELEGLGRVVAIEALCEAVRVYELTTFCCLLISTGSGINQQRKVVS